MLPFFPPAAIEVAFSHPILADSASGSIATSSIPIVPFYSQFADVAAPAWKKKACGITSLAMVLDYYGNASDVNALLDEGVRAGAYLNSAGWTYRGLIAVAEAHGLTGTSVDLGGSSMTSAYAKIAASLQSGPVIASIHYKFDPKSTIPHLVVITGIKDGEVFYNDPAASGGNKSVSVDAFKAAWKKRYIIVRPLPQNRLASAA